MMWNVSPLQRLRVVPARIDAVDADFFDLAQFGDDRGIVGPVAGDDDLGRGIQAGDVVARQGVPRRHACRCCRFPLLALPLMTKVSPEAAFCAAIDDVTAIGRRDGIGVPDERVVAGIAVEDVVPQIAYDRVVAVATIDRVVAGKGIDRVVVGGAIQRVGECRGTAERRACGQGEVRGRDRSAVDLFDVDLTDRCTAGIPDRDACVVNRTILHVLDRHTGGKVRRRDPECAEVDPVLVGGVPPSASKLLMMSAPKPAAL